MTMPVAVVTGGSRGLGREIVNALGRAGYKVAFNYRHSTVDAGKTFDQTGDMVMALNADVGDLRQMEGMADRVSERWGRTDLLINNAGITKDGLLTKYDEEVWDEVLRVNLKGCFNTIKAFVPLMAQSGGGNIINISSYSGLRGKAGQSAYSASKAALIGMTYSLAKELSGHKIKVNCILPGYMPTGMGMGAKEAMEKAKAESVLRSLSNPADVAGFIACLSANDSITGQVFCLDSRI
jgi:3-oxoacyl-[acyl-carrier protein] reductase